MSVTHPNPPRQGGSIPLASLRAFEAAARLASFRAAAAELGLTPSAISHHIRDLEASIGNPLFYRGHREVSLTETGSRLASELTPAFSSIAAAYRTVQNRKTLRLTAAPLFSAQFILPKLDELFTLLRDVSIELESSIAVADLSSGRHDLALRFGPQPGPPLQSIEVCGAGLSIVAAPNLTKSQDTKQPLSIGDLPMLSLAQHPNAWSEVCDELGVTVQRRELFFDSYEGVLQAAEQGRGLALVPLIVCHQQLANGRLVKVVDRTFENGWRYWIAARPNVLPDRHLNKLAIWLATQVHAAIAA